MDKTTEIFRNAPVPKAVLLNIVPSVISMIMVLIYNLADMFFIGQTKNAYMVAAVSLATPAFLLFMAIGMLFGIGGTSLIARMLGEGRKKEAKNVSSFCFWTGLIVGILGMVFIWICLDSVSKMVGATPDTEGYVRDYLQIVALGIPFLIISHAFSNILRAEGHANKAMAGVIIGNLVNIVLDPVMILGLGWDVKGAALATSIGNLASAVFYILHFIQKKSILSIAPKQYKAGHGITKGVLAIGVPASLNSIMMSVSNIIINNLMTQHGDMAVAGLGVAIKVNMIAVMLLIGVGTGIQPLLGYCYGAGDRKRFMSVLKFSLCLAVGLSAIMTVICYFGASPMVSAFLENQNAHGFGMKFARIYIYSGPVLGVLFVMINTIQAMGAALPSLILSICRQGILYVPIIFIFNYTIHTPETLALAQPVTDYFATVLSVVLCIITMKRYFAIKERQPE